MREKDPARYEQRDEVEMEAVIRYKIRGGPSTCEKRMMRMLHKSREEEKEEVWLYMYI